MKRINNNEIKEILESKEFPKNMTEGKSIIILTQSWCPQWTYMKEYLPNIEEKESLSVYYIEYDNEPNFEEIMLFKESTFKNDEVPYCRYYSKGKFLKDSNFVYEDDIMNSFK